MPKHAARINLLQDKKKALFENILDWALSIGRVVVIFTEVIALGAFVYRFSLDSKLSDLHTKIKQQEVYITFFKDDESKYRNLQDRLATSKTLIKKQQTTSQIFFTIEKSIPQDMLISSISLTNKSIVLTLATANVASLTTLVNNLRQLPFVEGISIDRIQNKPATNVVNASLTITRIQ